MNEVKTLPPRRIMGDEDSPIWLRRGHEVCREVCRLNQGNEYTTMHSIFHKDIDDGVHSYLTVESSILDRAFTMPTLTPHSLRLFSR